MTRPRPAALVMLLSLALLVGACGGSGSGEEVSASTDVNELLKQTFTGSKQVKSGNLELTMKLESTGGESQVDGPVAIRLAGPFQAQGGGKLPKFKLEASFEGAGQSIKAGATSTGEKGYLSFQGTDYVVEDQVFKQFKAGFEQAQKQGSGDQQSFASLGMDPRKWLTDPKNAGEAEVGDDDTIKITGGIDVAKLLDDVNNALAKASALGLQGSGQVPEKLTDQQKRQVTEAVSDPRVEIYTGKEDTILRRMVVDFGVDDKASGTSGAVAFDVSITRPQRGPGHRRAGRCQAVQRAARAARRARARRRGRRGLGRLRRAGRRRRLVRRPREVLGVHQPSGRGRREGAQVL